MAGKILTVANGIVVARIALTVLAAYSLLGNLGAILRLAAPFLILASFSLDALDGFVARKLGEASDFGAASDIAGDRITENILWLFFAYIGLVPLEIPVIFLLRSFIVDAFRWVGRETFSKKGKFSHLNYFFVSSRASRALYGFSKVSAFFLLALSRNVGVEEGTIGVPLRGISLGLVWFSAAFCIVRGVFSIYPYFSGQTKPGNLKSFIGKSKN